ncbi:hypothetical protein BDR26DRAFT_868228 [Obelidium mucronatum]|nr:hypothetical protein BDR26DRAFT_868228 [Obelidium mucronatum]
MYLFSSSEPDEICLDSFELSSSTFVLPKLQRVNAPLAFEVVETCQFSNLENKSWLLRTPNQAAHIMWVTLINKAIEQASIRFSMQPPPPARHGKINSRTEFALQNYFKSMGAAAATESVGGSTNSRFNREGEESASYLDILQEYDQFLEVVALPQNIRDDSAFGLSSAPVVSNALDYDGPTVYEMGLGGAHGMGRLRSIKSRKSVLSRRNSDTTTNAHLSQEFEDAWRFIAAPVRKSQLMFGIDENKAPTARDEEDLLELVGRGGKVDNGVGVAWLGRSQSEKTPVSNIQNTPPQKVLGFSARAKKWFGF